MKTFSSLRFQLAALKRDKKEFERFLENRNLFNRQRIIMRIRILRFKIWRIKQELENFI